MKRHLLELHPIPENARNSVNRMSKEARLYLKLLFSQRGPLKEKKGVFRNLRLREMNIY